MSVTHTQSRRSEPVELTPPQQDGPRAVPLEGLTLGLGSTYGYYAERLL